MTAQSPTVQRFIDALHTLEAGGDTQPLTGLVAASAEVLSIDGFGPRHGPDGMSELFTQYHEQFDHVETTFTRMTDNDTGATLEWSSDAVLLGGNPVAYTGITILDYTDGQITRFRTIYDSSALLRPAAGAQPLDDTTAAPGNTTAPTPGPGDQDGQGGQDGQDGPDLGGDPVVGRYGADSGFLPEADRAAATGRDR
jgi:ketosteroid isomerase-like protein